MALAVGLRAKNWKVRMNRVWKVYGTLTPSGTYPTGGDTLSFASFGLPQSAVGAQDKPLKVAIYGKAGFVYSYNAGTGRDDGKVMVFTNSAGGANAALTEHTNASYVAGVTGDTITFEAELSA